MHAASRLPAHTQRTLALVLAGGRGSRLQELTQRRAKPAVPFGGNYRIIDFTLSNCVNSGLRRIGVLTQYKAHDLIHHVRRAWGFLRPELDEFVELLPAQQRTPQEDWYSGTADAVYQNLDIVRQHRPDLVLVLAGDHVYKMDYTKLLAWHVERAADVTVACIEVPLHSARAFGVMEVDRDHRVIGFLEKPERPPCMPASPDHALASMGIYVFNAEFLSRQLVRDASRPDSGHDFGGDLLPYLVPRHRVFAHPFRQACVGSAAAAEPYWRDVGTIDAYWAANLDLTAAVPGLDLYDPSWPIGADRRPRPPTKFVCDQDGRRGTAVDSLVADGCVVSGATVRRSVLSTDVAVEPGAVVEESVLLPNSVVGRGCRLRRVILDEGCRVPAGLAVGGSLQHDTLPLPRTPAGVTLLTADALDRLDCPATAVAV